MHPSCFEACSYLVTWHTVFCRINIKQRNAEPVVKKGKCSFYIAQYPAIGPLRELYAIFHPWHTYSIDDIGSIATYREGVALALALITLFRYCNGHGCSYLLSRCMRNKWILSVISVITRKLTRHTTPYTTRSMYVEVCLLYTCSAQ